jgi:hypothetical protein
VDESLSENFKLNRPFSVVSIDGLSLMQLNAGLITEIG